MGPICQGPEGHSGHWTIGRWVWTPSVAKPARVRGLGKAVAGAAGAVERRRRPEPGLRGGASCSSSSGGAATMGAGRWA